MNVLLHGAKCALVLLLLTTPSHAAVFKDHPVCHNLDDARELYPIWVRDPDAAREFLIEDAQTVDPLFPSCVVPEKSTVHLFASREKRVFANGFTVHFIPATYDENGSTYHGYTFVVRGNLDQEI